MSKDVVADDKVVFFHYVLKDTDGNVIESSRDDEENPLYYLHGAGNIVPGLEKAMLGKTPGDTFTAEVPPEEGYGERIDEEPRPLARELFPDGLELEEGMPIRIPLEDGSTIPVWITSIEEEWVHVDLNHPLAGSTLVFDVEVLRIREASKDEISHGHAHGPDGHAHH